MINPFILSTTVNSDLVYMGLDKLLNGRIFLPVQPVYTEPCKFCYR